MGEKKAQVNPQDPSEFGIDLGNNKTAKIKLPKTKAGDTYETDKNPESYEVWQKDVPTETKTSWVDPDDGQTKTITWMFNFGLKNKKKQQYDAEKTVQFFYVVELDVVEGKKAVYWDGNTVRAFAKQDNKFVANINLSDPPTGYTP